MQRAVSAIRRPSGSGAALSVAVALVSLPLLGLVLVMGAHLVPDRLVLDELVTAIDKGQLTPANYGPATSGAFMDFFTDCIGITIGLGDDPDTSRWSAAIRSPTLGSCDSAVPRVQGWVDGDGLKRSREYFRYWHGYAVPVRPLVAAVGVAGARTVTFWLMVGGLVGLGRSLGRRHGWAVTAALLGTILLTTDLLELPRSLPHAYGALTAIVAAWWAHRSVATRSDAQRVALVATVSGAAFVYVDILTIAAGAWTLSTFVITIAASRSRSGAALARTGALAATCWLVGYAWTWAAKWALASVVYGVGDVRENVGEAVETRIDGEYQAIDLGPFRSSWTTLSRWWEQPLTVPVLVALAALVIVVVRRGGAAWTGRWPDRLVIASPALLAIVWFETLRNHSQVHAGFTYRSWGIVVGVIAAAAVTRLETVRHQPDPSRVPAPPRTADSVSRGGSTRDVPA